MRLDHLLSKELLLSVVCWWCLSRGGVGAGGGWLVVGCGLARPFVVGGPLMGGTLTVSVGVRVVLVP